MDGTSGGSVLSPCKYGDNSKVVIVQAGVPHVDLARLSCGQQDRE
jgi:hypothetical protein